MSHDLASDDEALLTALAVLEQDPGDPPGRGGSLDSPGSSLAPTGGNTTHVEAVDTLTRLYHEALGLIPSSLPPMAPHPEVKRRLMAAISAGGLAAPPKNAGSDENTGRYQNVETDENDQTDETEKNNENDEVSEAGRAGPPLPFSAPIAANREVARRDGASRSWLTLAAALILGLLGVGAWLFHGLTERDAAVARLTAERAEALLHLSDAEARLQRAEIEAKNMRQGFSVVTSPAVEVCTLRPSSPMPAVAGAHGILFVAADHQHWYMSLRGLQPAGAGKVYQLWFVGPGGPVSAGTFSGDPAAPWEVSSEHMPPDTREVRITVEDGAGSPAPRGQEVLRNTELFRVL